MTTNRLCNVCGAAAHWNLDRVDLCVTCHADAVRGYPVQDRTDGWTVIPEEGQRPSLEGLHAQKLREDVRVGPGVQVGPGVVGLEGTTGFETQAGDLDGGAA